MSAMRSPAALWLAACLAGAGCRDAVAPDERGSPAEFNNAPPPLQPIGPVLAFQRHYPDGNSDIFSIAASGKYLTQLTFGAAADSQPAWSPDGKKLAWVEAANGISQIYVMNPDGSGKTNLSHSNTRDRLPVWSPNGSRILFERRVVTLMLKTYWEIYVMNADGSAQLNLSQHAANDQHARWSPSGSEVVFMSQRDGNMEVYRVSAKGTGLLRLTQNALEDDAPDWSPDGQTIAFERHGASVKQVYTMNVDGSAQTPLNSGLNDTGRPRWSPSGSKLLVNFEYKLMVLNPNGSEPVVVAIDASAVGLGDAAWSPDGSRIAYRGWDPYLNQNEATDIEGLRTVGADGGGKQVVTNNVFRTLIRDMWPTWKP
jgi:Tol biopolymer transport system component